VDKTEQIKAECLFCGETNFEVPHDGYSPNVDDTLKCVNCGKMNNYGDMYKNVEKKGRELVQKEIEKMFKGFNLK